MIGAACALGLARIGLNVGIVEKTPLPRFQQHDPYDVRISAISVTSVALLEQLGAWQAIQDMRVTPYHGLETWEIDGFATRFRAAEIGLDKLGFMVENRVIQLGLWQSLQHLPNCQQAVGFEHIQAKRDQGLWHITLDGQPRFSAPLLIACDGANSQARQWAGIGVTAWQYRHHCLLATVETEQPSDGITWQQFFPSGPRAFLPLEGHHGCIVWYDSPARIAALKSLPLTQLREEIHRYFPAQLGRVQVRAVGAFPLTRQHAQRYIQEGVVLVGDAAHTINPLAGQGVNLGFKDVDTLLRVVEQAVKKGKNIAEPMVLQQYERGRKADNLLMQSAMDGFYKVFKSELWPLKMARNAALLMADRAGIVKKQALKYALGL